MRLLLTVGAVAFALIAFPVAPSTAASDPQALEIADRTMQSMGGPAAWSATRLVHFDWAVERDGETVVLYHHWWDRWSGDYRLAGQTREGEKLDVLFNVQTRQGRVWIDGELLAGEAAEAQLEQAYGRFINDSYWLLMPWKWLDDGVRLSYEGEREAEGRSFDVVRLDFEDGIGLTSNDHYFAWVARDSGLMELWQYVLQDEAGAPGADEPSGWEWTDWVETDSGLRVSTVKRRIGGEGDVRIKFPLVDLRSTVTADELAALFRSPEGGDR